MIIALGIITFSLNVMFWGIGEYAKMAKKSKKIKGNSK